MSARLALTWFGRGLAIGVCIACVVIGVVGLAAVT